MTSTTSRPERSLNSLQVLRGVAACVVAFYHSHLIIAQPDYIGVEVFGPVATRGWLGVNIFFVLSGFIILFAHQRDIGNWKSIPDYAIKRFIRVYPIYWIFLTAYIAAAAAGIGHPDFGWSVPNMVSSYALINVSEALTLPLKVAWTLFYEVTFYAAFLLFLINVRLGIAVFTVWSAAILVAVFGFGHREMGILNAWNLYFPVGMLSYLCYQRLSSRHGPAILIVGCIALVAVASTYLGQRDTFSANDPLCALGFLLPCALIITGATLTEKGRSWTPPRVLLLLGEASYSIYLVHSGVISVLAIVYAKFHLTSVSPVLYFFVVAISSIVAGIVAHKVVEQPLLRLLRGALLGRKSAAYPKPQLTPVREAMTEKE